ncbi:hypothetical protein DE146DRAFT_758190 [Phaeosphaeria sp. MPI-PUGE-AT-0046c]|nr:hypothetical protein DE146DRAFT_758190 [Phaeosphaeria sp. MPI-PUGE-AT-0046c]
MCGTICYAGPTTVTSQTTTIYEEYPVTWTSGLKYPSPSPNCSIGFSGCLSLLTSYTSAFSEYWYGSWASIRSLTTMPVRPSCSACVSTGCTFAHAGMSLYYWPVTANVSRDYCAWDPVGGRATTNLPNPNTTYTPITTGPYAVVDGITMFPGNVYLSLMEPHVIDNCGTQISRKSPGPNIVTIASSELYSVRKYPHNLIPWSVNYDDFNEPTPWSAYYGGQYCANNRPLCSVVFQHEYYPVMVMPPEIRNLDPNWATCAFDKYGIFDPPIALQSIGNFLSSAASATPTPIDPVPVVTPTPAKPGQPGGGGVPVVTPPPTSDPQSPPGNNNPAPNNPQDPQGPPGNDNPSPNDPPSNNHPNPAPGQIPAPNPNPNPTGSPNNSPGNPAPPVVTVGPTVIPIDPTGGVVINPGITLTPGGVPVVISSTTFSVGNAGLTIISPSTSTQIPFGNGPVTVPLGPGNAPLTLNPGGSVIVGGTTLRPGAPPVTVDGTTMSVGPSGIVLIDPSGAISTIPIPAGDPSTPQVLTIGKSAYTYINDALSLAPGITLHFGDPAATISGTAYSIGPSGLIIIGPAGTSTIPISLTTQVITLGGHTYTMHNGNLVLGPGTTIRLGDPAVTVDGTTFSVGPTGVVVLSSGGGTTVAVTRTGGGGTPTGPNGKMSTSAAGRVRIEWMVRMAIALMALMTAL